MGIKRLLQVGLILASSIATPAWSAMIKDGGSSDNFDLWNIDTFNQKKAVRIIIDWRSFGPFDRDVFNSRVFGNRMNFPSDGGATASLATDSNGSAPAVPAPGVLGLLGIGLIGMMLRRRCMAA